MQVHLLCVEGVHDVAFVQRILSAFGFAQKRLLADLGELAKHVPRSFPANKEGDIHRRVDVPSFHSKGEEWVVVHGAGSDSQLASALANSLNVMDDAGMRPSSIGLVLDADSDDPPTQFRKRQAEWDAKRAGNAVCVNIPFPDSPGAIAVGPPPFGVFVMPDNVNCGRLENLLLLQGKSVYPVLHGKAESFIQDAKATDGAIPEPGGLTRDGKNEGKAVLHAMTSVLKPGRTLQASIVDHQWVPAVPSEFPECFTPFVAFLRRLLSL